jgi:hypothetical protein
VNDLNSVVLLINKDKLAEFCNFYDIQKDLIDYELIMKKILLPIDFSETSDNAFVYAIEMAKIFKAELILLHTFDLPIVDSQSLPMNYLVI